MEDRIKAWMSGDPITASAGESALAAHERMIRFGIRHLPVIDAERRVVGVLAVDDLRAAFPVGADLRAPLGADSRGDIASWTVAELMTHAPETLGPDDTLQHAAERMADRRIGCLPIVDGADRLWLRRARWHQPPVQSVRPRSPRRELAPPTMAQ